MPLNGLLSTYNVFKTSIHTRSQSSFFKDLHLRLESEKRAIDDQSKADDLNSNNPALAMLARFANYGHCTACSRNVSSRGHIQSLFFEFHFTFSSLNFSGPCQTQPKSYSSFTSNHVNCQICQRSSQNALDCYYRMNQEFHAHFATLATSSASKYLVNSAASPSDAQI